MIEARKLDIVFFGARLIIVEYLIGVHFSIALGAPTLHRSASGWQLALGIYLILFGINYIPMPIYAIGVTKTGSARDELFDEPLFVLIAALRQRGWKASSRT